MLSRKNLIRLGLVVVMVGWFAMPASFADIYKRVGPDGSVYYTDTPTTPDYEMFIREGPPLRTWREYVNILAERADLAPSLVRAVIYVESGENPSAVSHKGAMGLMQLMPATADQLGVEKPMNPRQNVQGGVLYLAQMVRRFDGNIRLALAAYNAGPGAVEKYGGIPPFPETRNFVQRVLKVKRAIEENADS